VRTFTDRLRRGGLAAIVATAPLPLANCAGSDAPRVIERTLYLSATQRDRLLVALDRSLPPEGSTTTPGESGRRAARALREVLASHPGGPITLRARVMSDDALVTAYYAPEFPGALQRDALHRHPLYALPQDPAIRSASRAAVEAGDLLRGHEVAFLADPFDAYIAHVNGSARLRLPDGSHINVGHVATNGRPYTSLGRMLIDDGVMARDEVTMQSLRTYFEAHPDALTRYSRRNERFVFFEIVPEGAWPRGSTGVALEPGVSAAVDPEFIPWGAPLIVETTTPRYNAATGAWTDERLLTIVVAQDTGGAIIGPDRIDLFFGVGDEAGDRAGRQASRGRIALIESAAR
jgi:membrane-bound lytic murein transglycosylase A